MTKEEKREMVKDLVIEGLKNGKAVDEVCEAVYAEYSETVRISELTSLVRSIGKEAGLIKTVKERRMEAMDDVSKIPEIEGEDNVRNEIDRIVGDYGVTEQWIKSVLKEEFDYTVPKRPRQRRMAGWRLAMAEAIGNDPDISLEDVRDAIRPHVCSTKVATDYTNDYAWMVKAAVRIALS